MKTLILNAGSSSLKATLYSNEKEVVSFSFVDMWSSCELKVRSQDGATSKKLKIKSISDAISIIAKELTGENFVGSLNEIDRIGHRVVHGGNKFKETTMIDNDVIAEISKLSKLAPLHNPNAVKAMKSSLSKFKHAKQFASFDTSFHKTIPELNYTYAIDQNIATQYGIRKYGFHGLSHKFILSSMKEELGKENLNIISIHLGSGASMCAIKDSKSFDISMGFTPLDGLMMGTRSGNIDVSIIEYLFDNSKLKSNQIFEMLNFNSGLKGVSKTSGSMIDIVEASENGNKDARLAFDLFIQKIVDYISNYANKLENKIDAIVFAGGIGENQKNVWQAVANKMFVTKFSIRKNAKVNKVVNKISTESSSIPVYVVKTDEQREILNEIKTKK